MPIIIRRKMPGLIDIGFRAFAINLRQSRCAGRVGVHVYTRVLPTSVRSASAGNRVSCACDRTPHRAPRARICKRTSDGTQFIFGTYTHDRSVVPIAEAREIDNICIFATH